MAGGDNPLLTLPWGQALSPADAGATSPAAPVAPQPTPAPQPSPTPQPAPQNPLPSPAPTATPMSPDTSSGPMPLPAPYQQPANRGGVVKNALTRMFYGMGQGMLHHYGMPTDYDIQKTQFDQALQANELQLKQAGQALQYQQVTLPNGVTMPLAVAQRVYPALLNAQSREDVVRINKQFMITPQGIYRTGLYGGEAGIVPGTASGTYVDDALIGAYPQLAPVKGQFLKTGDLLRAAQQEIQLAPETTKGVQNLAIAQGVVQAPTYHVTQRTPPRFVGIPGTTAPVAQIPTTAPAGGAGLPAATQRMPPGSPGRTAVTGGGAAAGVTVRPLQMPGGGPVMPAAAWNEFDTKYLQPANTVEKSYQMMNSVWNERQAALAKGQTLPTGAQSMVALSQHLATTFGGVKGARITKDMIAEHLGARSISDDALAAFQKFTNGDPLSPDQWAAFHNLIAQSRNIQWQLAAQYGRGRNFDLKPFLPADLQKLANPQTQGSQGPSPAAQDILNKWAPK